MGPVGFPGARQRNRRRPTRSRAYGLKTDLGPGAQATAVTTECHGAESCGSCLPSRRRSRRLLGRRTTTLFLVDHTLIDESAGWVARRGPLPAIVGRRSGTTVAARAGLMPPRRDDGEGGYRKARLSAQFSASRPLRFARHTPTLMALPPFPGAFFGLYVSGQGFEFIGPPRQNVGSVPPVPMKDTGREPLRNATVSAGVVDAPDAARARVARPVE